MAPSLSGQFEHRANICVEETVGTPGIWVTNFLFSFKAIFVFSLVMVKENNSRALIQGT